MKNVLNQSLMLFNSENFTYFVVDLCMCTSDTGHFTGRHYEWLVPTNLQTFQKVVLDRD